jgi:hypothetical protein
MVDEKKIYCAICEEEIFSDEVRVPYGGTIYRDHDELAHIDCAAEEDDAIDHERHWGDDK